MDVNGRGTLQRRQRGGACRGAQLAARCVVSRAASRAVTNLGHRAPAHSAPRPVSSHDLEAPANATPSASDADLDALEGMARMLDASGGYRVLRRFAPRARYAPPGDGPLRTALFVDTESTGLDTANDAVIEFAAVPFTYEARTGAVCDVREAYVALEDPERPIPADATTLTGITDAMVRGRRIDDARVAELLGTASLVIAHNAAFDHPLLERRFPAFADAPWACSHAEVPWQQFGCRGSKLDYLLWHRCGEFFGGHRAEEDCLAAIHVLATPGADGALPFGLLLESARRPTYRVWAVGAPFETKDVLKARGYRFHGGPGARAKTWYRDCAEAALGDELAWLCANCCAGRDARELRQGHVDRFTARERYSGRLA